MKILFSFHYETLSSSYSAPPTPSPQKRKKINPYFSPSFRKSRRTVCTFSQKKKAQHTHTRWNTCAHTFIHARLQAICSHKTALSRWYIFSVRFPCCHVWTFRLVTPHRRTPSISLSSAEGRNWVDSRSVAFFIQIMRVQIAIVPFSPLSPLSLREKRAFFVFLLKLYLRYYFPLCVRCGAIWNLQR